MKAYLELLDRVLTQGEKRGDRTGTGTLSLFGEHIKFPNVYLDFPLLTTKKMHTKSIVHELLWMLSGSTNVKYLNDNGVTIWNEWADENGELGPVYGKQWRHWEGRHDKAVIDGTDFTGRVTYHDQISDVVTSLQNNPMSRRHIVSAWNVADVDSMKLPPCHCLFQFYVSNHSDGEEESNSSLSLHLYQRSADIFLGVPFNIASYALLLSLVARSCNMLPKNLTISFGDLHLYLNHVEQAKEQLSRKPMDPCFLGLTPRESVFDYRYEDITFLDYNSHPAIKADVSV